eukprot:10127817-Lingulodinium_polyedra.AAC.1
MLARCASPQPPCKTTGGRLWGNRCARTCRTSGCTRPQRIAHPLSSRVPRKRGPKPSRRRSPFPRSVHVGANRTPGGICRSHRCVGARRGPSRGARPTLGGTRSSPIVGRQIRNAWP